MYLLYKDRYWLYNYTNLGWINFWGSRSTLLLIEHRWSSHFVLDLIWKLNIIFNFSLCNYVDKGQLFMWHVFFPNVDTIKCSRRNFDIFVPFIVPILSYIFIRYILYMYVYTKNVYTYMILYLPNWCWACSYWTLRKIEETLYFSWACWDVLCSPPLSATQIAACTLKGFEIFFQCSRNLETYLLVKGLVVETFYVNHLCLNQVPSDIKK